MLFKELKVLFGRRARASCRDCVIPLHSANDRLPVNSLEGSQTRETLSCCVTRPGIMITLVQAILIDSAGSGEQSFVFFIKVYLVPLFCEGYGCRATE